MADFGLPKVRHPPAAIGFMPKDGWRALILWPENFANPNGEAVQHASGQRLEAPRFPRHVSLWQIEDRFAAEAIKIGAD
jgi:hypothetical protein